MTLASVLFVTFLLAVVLLHHRLPQRWRTPWLLATSYAFCLSWAWQFALVVALVTAVNHLLARRIAAAPEAAARRFLYAGIAFDLAALALFKYADFFVPQLVLRLAGLGVETAGGGLRLLIPVGLSYYVLQAISYLVDVRKGRVESLPTATEFALYMAYFPKLVAGPIEHARKFVPRLRSPQPLTADRIARAAELILLGAFRKLVIADTLIGLVPESFYQRPGAEAGGTTLLWLVLIVLQIYNDFAGYTNIARGASLLFGIELSENFAQPFFSRDFGELWNRWHISLSHWLRDYVYYPLVEAIGRRWPKRRAGLGRTLPPLVTMAVSGLWHGLSWHMLLWGTLQGAVQVGEQAWERRRSLGPRRRQAVWRQTWSVLRVNALFIVAGVAFAFPLDSALSIWKNLLFGWGTAGTDVTAYFLLGVSLLVATSFLLDVLRARWPRRLLVLGLPRPLAATVTILILLAIVMTTHVNGQTPFVYRGF